MISMSWILSEYWGRLHWAAHWKLHAPTTSSVSIPVLRRIFLAWVPLLFSEQSQGGTYVCLRIDSSHCSLLWLVPQQGLSELNYTLLLYQGPSHPTWPLEMTMELTWGWHLWKRLGLRAVMWFEVQRILSLADCWIKHHSTFLCLNFFIWEEGGASVFCVGLLCLNEFMQEKCQA